MQSQQISLYTLAVEIEVFRKNVNQEKIGVFRKKEKTGGWTIKLNGNI